MTRPRHKCASRRGRSSLTYDLGPVPFDASARPAAAGGPADSYDDGALTVLLAAGQ